MYIIDIILGLILLATIITAFNSTAGIQFKKLFALVLAIAGGTALFYVQSIYDLTIKVVLDLFNEQVQPLLPEIVSKYITGSYEIVLHVIIYLLAILVIYAIVRLILALLFRQKKGTNGYILSYNRPHKIWRFIFSLVRGAIWVVLIIQVLSIFDSFSMLSTHSFFSYSYNFLSQKFPEYVAWLANNVFGGLL